MQQLDFWPAEHPAPYAQKHWEALRVEDQAAAVAMVARLIAQAVDPEQCEEEEASDEQ
jgi:hypothetical protein